MKGFVYILGYYILPLIFILKPMGTLTSPTVEIVLRVYLNNCPATFHVHEVVWGSAQYKHGLFDTISL